MNRAVEYEIEESEWTSMLEMRCLYNPQHYIVQYHHIVTCEVRNALRGHFKLVSVNKVDISHKLQQLLSCRSNHFYFTDMNVTT